MATIERVCRKQRLALAAGMTPHELCALHRDGDQRRQIRRIPGMQPAGAFLGDLTVMARTLVAGAIVRAEATSAKPAAKKDSIVRSPKSASQKPGGRK